MSRVAPESWPAASCKKGRSASCGSATLGICNPFCAAAGGQENKPDGAVIFERCLRVRKGSFAKQPAGFRLKHFECKPPLAVAACNATRLTYIMLSLNF